MSYCKLTETSPGMFGLPVVSAQTRTPSAVFNGEYRLISELTEAQRQGLGWATFNEVPMSDTNYLPGIHLDTFTAYGVTRTYPNPVIRPLADVRSMKLTALAAHRYAIENGGMVWSSVGVDTTDRTKLLLTGAFAQANGNPQYSKRWKVAPGQYIALTNAQLKALAQALDDHVTSAFKAEEAHATAIMAMAASAEVVAYDFKSNIVGSEWPANPLPTP